MRTMIALGLAALAAGCASLTPTPTATPVPPSIWTASGTGTDVVTARLADGVHVCRVRVSGAARRDHVLIRATGRVRGSSLLLNRFGAESYDLRKFIRVGGGQRPDDRLGYVADFDGAIDFKVEVPRPARVGERQA